MATKTSTLPKLKRPDPPEVPMKVRGVRCDDPTWDAAAAKAKADGHDLSTVIRHYLREYAKS